MQKSIPSGLAALFAFSLLCVCLVRSTASWGQMVIVDERYYVTELRPDKNMVGVSAGTDKRTRTWVDVTPQTRIATSVRKGQWTRSTNITRSTLFQQLKPGMRIHVNGGRDWDQHVAAKKIWF